VGTGIAAVAGVGDDGLRVRLAPPQGLAVTRVLPDSPAALAGLAPGRWVVSVDGVVARDGLPLWRALWSRRVSGLGWVGVQSSVRTGSGTGMGFVTEAPVLLRPRLSVPITAVGLAGVALSGLAALTVATAAALRGPLVSAGPLVGLASSAALLAVVRVWGEAGYGQLGPREILAFWIIGATGALIALWLTYRRLPRPRALVLWLATLAAAVLALAEPVIVPTAEVPPNVAELMGFASGAAPALVTLLAAGLAGWRTAPQATATRGSATEKRAPHARERYALSAEI